MKTPKAVDVLIIGQGLAGSLMAMECIQRGYETLVIDSGKPGSSYAAAGLFNPITGRKMVKTWMADVLFDEVMHQYPKMEALLGTQFYHPTPIFRPFVAVEEYNDWQGRWSDDSFEPYIAEVTAPHTFSEHCHDGFGGILLQRSGWVELPKLLQAARQWLLAQDALWVSDYQPTKLSLSEEGVAYEGVTAKWAVSCTGVQATQDPHWSWLPFRPVKGEVLQIETETPLPRIYNRGVFVLPTDGNFAKVGSTYHNHDFTLTPTEKGKTELLEKLNALLRVPFQIVDHWAGIRPATKDRRPMIGQHPAAPRYFILNGLGAKGVSLAPFFVKQLADVLFTKHSLWTDIDIQRFRTYYK